MDEGDRWIDIDRSRKGDDIQARTRTPKSDPHCMRNLVMTVSRAMLASTSSAAIVLVLFAFLSVSLSLSPSLSPLCLCARVCVSVSLRPSSLSGTHAHERAGVNRASGSRRRAATARRSIKYPDSCPTLSKSINTKFHFFIPSL